MVSRRFRALVAHPQVEALGELAELLGGLGLQVETARSTVEALNKLRNKPAHVIVSYHTRRHLRWGRLARVEHPRMRPRRCASRW